MSLNFAKGELPTPTELSLYATEMERERVRAAAADEFFKLGGAADNILISEFGKAFLSPKAWPLWLLGLTKVLGMASFDVHASGLNINNVAHGGDGVGHNINNLDNVGFGSQFIGPDHFNQTNAWAVVNPADAPPTFFDKGINPEMTTGKENSLRSTPIAMWHSSTGTTLMVTNDGQLVIGNTSFIQGKDILGDGTIIQLVEGQNASVVKDDPGMTDVLITAGNSPEAQARLRELVTPRGQRISTAAQSAMGEILNRDGAKVLQLQVSPVTMDKSVMRMVLKDHETGKVIFDRQLDKVNFSDLSGGHDALIIPQMANSGAGGVELVALPVSPDPNLVAKYDSSVNAWFYVDKQGIEKFQVNPDGTLSELVPQIETITFTTSGGAEVTMNKFDDVQSALQYVVDNGKWVSGDIQKTNWNDLRNATNYEKKIMKEDTSLPEFSRGGTFAESNNPNYVIMYVGGVTGGAFIEFQLPNGDLTRAFVVDANPMGLYNGLLDRSIPLPARTTSSTNIPTATP